jgi:hypothetical protein
MPLSWASAGHCDPAGWRSARSRGCCRGSPRTGPHRAPCRCRRRCRSGDTGSRSPQSASRVTGWAERHPGCRCARHGEGLQQPDSVRCHAGVGRAVQVERVTRVATSWRTTVGIPDRSSTTWDTRISSTPFGTQSFRASDTRISGTTEHGNLPVILFRANRCRPSRYAQARANWGFLELREVDASFRAKQKPPGCTTPER